MKRVTPQAPLPALGSFVAGPLGPLLGRDITLAVMDFAHSPEDEAFRAELRGWLDENLQAFFADYADDADRLNGSCCPRADIPNVSKAAKVARQNNFARCEAMRKTRARYLFNGCFTCLDPLSCKRLRSL